jgi:acyl carrier protein
VTTIGDFVTVVQEELGLEITLDDISRSLDEVTGWDSVHLLTLAVCMGRRTGRPIVLPDLLEAASLADIYAAVSA